MDVLSPLSLSSVILIYSSTGSAVHVLMLSIQAVRGLPRLYALGIVPCIISLSPGNSQLLCWSVCGFTAVVISLRSLIRISIKLEHIFIYDCYLKNLVQSPPGVYPHRLEAKKRFLGPTSNFDRKYIYNGTRHQQSERNLPIYRESPTRLPNLMNFGIETAEKGWRVFAHPLTFLIGRHCQPYRMNVM